jgi:hypothetical protein
MANFKELNWDNFKGSIDVEHFMGFLQYINEEDISKNESIEMIISNVVSHVEPYREDYKNILTEIIEKVLLDVIKEREINLNEDIAEKINKLDVKSNIIEKENILLYLVCNMLKNNQLNMIVNHGVSQEDTKYLNYILSAFQK